MNTYFYRLPRLWNSLPIANRLVSASECNQIKIKNFLWNHFLGNLIIVHVIFIIIVHVLTAASLLQQTIFQLFVITVYFVDSVTVNK